MLLAHAIRNNGQSLAQAQTTYKQNVAAVNQLVTGVLSSALPTLQSNPPDWQAYVNAYEASQTSALDWVNCVMGRLLSVPGDVQTYDLVITTALADAQAQAAALTVNPSNPTAVAALNADLTTLKSQCSLVVTFISASVTAIQNFNDQLPTLAANLQSVTNQAIADSDADQAQVQQLQQDISALQDEISSLTAAIVGLAIADGVALVLGTVATIVAWPFGALTWLVLGPAVIAATVAIALDAEQIKADKGKIEVDQAQITGLTADVAALNLLSQQFAGLASQAAALTESLQAILTEWQSLESDINTAVGDVQQAMADASAAAYGAVTADLNNALTEWNAVTSQAGGLVLDLQVSDAQLQVGMTSTQVQQAVTAGQTVGFIEYCNRVGLRGRQLANA
jgi:predicted  nucleic acid-binding Zn-ribbon protein